MKLCQILCIILVAFFSSYANASSGVLCTTVDDCIQQIPVYAKKFEDTYGSLDPEQSAFIESSAKLGDPLVDKLIPLLDEPDEGIATIAAAILRDVNHIDGKYLSNINRGLDRNLSWLAPALGRINTSSAAEETVKRFLVSESAPYNQEAYAIELQGARVAPYIAKAAICAYGCNNSTYSLLSQVIGLRVTDHDKGVLAQELINAISKEEIQDEISENVLSLFWSIGTAGKELEPQLLQLQISKPNLKESINYALIGIGSNLSGKIFLELLKKSEADSRVLQQIASRGLASRDAGPEIIKLLESSDINFRLQVVITLGLIGYSEAAERISQFLWDPVDVRINYAAAVALGNYNNENFRAALLEVANNHWYPPVRQVANKAIDKINQKISSSNREAYFLEVVENNSSCKRETFKFKNESKSKKLYLKSDRRALKKLSFKSEVISYGAADENEQLEKAKSKGKTPIIKVTESNMVEIRKPIIEVPHVALKVTGGWLAGSDNGEWGGNLVFVEGKEKSQKILEENIEDIYEFGERYIAVTGLSHLGYSEGAVYEIYKNNGLWSAKIWRMLPGAPMGSGMLSSGDVVIDLYGGTSLVLLQNGQFHFIDCTAAK